MTSDRSKHSDDVMGKLEDLRESAVLAVQELMQMIKRHPQTARNILVTGTKLFQQWFSSPLYRRVWDAYQMWKYRDEGQFFEVDEFGMDEAMLDVIRPFFQFLYYQYFRVETEGSKNIPTRGPALLIANHSGGLAYDGVMTNLAVYNNLNEKRYLRFLVDDFVYYLPFVGTFIQRSGGIRACHENAMRLLDHGHLILVFPEGIKGTGKLFDDRYKLQRFGRGGYVRLAMRTGVPVIPTAIIGSEEIHPLIWKSETLGKSLGIPYFPFTPTFPWLGPLGLIPLPTKWRIVFGKPFSFGKYKPSDAEKPALVKKVSNSIRSRIQGMLDERLKKRESIWY